MEIRLSSPRTDSGRVNSRLVHCLARLRHDDRGSMIVEAAFALPILITLMVGIVSYGVWLMAAHSVQEAANSAARAALAGLDQTERDALAQESISDGVLSQGTVDASLVTVETALDGPYYTVTVRYDVAKSGVFTSGAIPLPDDVIERTAVVKLSSF